MDLKRKLKTLSIADKVRIIDMVDNRKMPKNKVAKHVGIPFSTLSTILKNKEKILRHYQEGSQGERQRIRFSAYPMLEYCLLSWMVRIRNDMSVTGPVIRKQAEVFGKELGYLDFKASSGWLENFKRRYGIHFGCFGGEVSFVMNSNAVAAAAAASEEPSKFEPNVIIKEELLDPDEESDGPQISSASTFPEFILPDPKKECSSTDAKPCDLDFKPTVELTFCVEDESSPKASTSSAGDEPKTAVTTPLCIVPEGSSSSRKRSFSLPKDRDAFPEKKRKGSQDEQASEAGSAPDSEGMVERPRDHLDAYGEYIAAKLRLLDWKSCAYVQKAISDILFEAEIKKSTNDPPSNRSLYFEHDKSIAGRCPLPNLR